MRVSKQARKARVLAQRGRASERGATLLVVLLVLTLLVGIGTFAARSSQLATVSSGHVRHQTQARYVGEYGLMMTTALLGGSGGQSYLRQMSQPTADKCTAQATNAMVQPTCYKVTSKDVQIQLAAQSFNLCEAATTTYAGSLGMANAEGLFSVELTDKSQGFTPSGFDTAGGKPLKFYYVTATAMGQVRITNTGTTTLDAASAESASTQTLRSRLLAGPYLD